MMGDCGLYIFILCFVCYFIFYGIYRLGLFTLEIMLDWRLFRLKYGAIRYLTGPEITSWDGVRKFYSWMRYH